MAAAAVPVIVIVAVPGLVVATSPAGSAPVNDTVAVGTPEATMVIVWATPDWNTGPVTTSVLSGTVPVFEPAVSQAETSPP